MAHRIPRREARRYVLQPRRMTPYFTQTSQGTCTRHDADRTTPNVSTPNVTTPTKYSIRGKQMNFEVPEDNKILNRH